MRTTLLRDTVLRNTVSKNAVLKNAVLPEAVLRKADLRKTAKRARLFVFACSLGGALAFAATDGFASAPSDLAACQATVGKEGRKFSQQYVRVVGACLDRFSGLVIGAGEDPSVVAASIASTCVRDLSRLFGTSNVSRTPAGRLHRRVLRSCDPDQPDSSLAFSVSDVIGGGAGIGGVLSEGIAAGGLSSWCGQRTGALPVDSVEGWNTCLQAALTCSGNQQLSSRYPRMVEWLTLLDPPVAALTDDGDEDAADVLDALRDLLAAIDEDLDGRPDLACGLPTVCLNGIADGAEACDLTDLGGATCLSEGFDGGSLACDATCNFDTSGCLDGKHVFVTQDRYGVPADFGSLADADALCQNLAETAGLAAAGVPVFRAWLSDDADDAIDRIGGVGSGPFFDTRGNLVKATGFGDGAALDYGIVYDASGAPFSDVHASVHTGTDQFGRASAAHCTNWTSGGSSVRKGTAGTVHSAQWTSGGTSSPCRVIRHLYCMEEE